MEKNILIKGLKLGEVPAGSHIFKKGDNFFTKEQYEKLKDDKVYKALVSKHYLEESNVRETEHKIELKEIEDLTQKQSEKLNKKHEDKIVELKNLQAKEVAALNVSFSGKEGALRTLISEASNARDNALKELEIAKGKATNLAKNTAEHVKGQADKIKSLEAELKTIKNNRAS